MTFDEFLTKYNGKLVDFDGFYGGQCMDLYQQYNREVISGPHIPANAYQVWDNYPKDFYDKIENTPEGMPQKGDVVIWNQNTGGGFGHIAIATGNETDTTSMFESFDQNWPIGSTCHYQRHSYNSVYGWLRPKNLPQLPNQPSPTLQFTDQTVIPKELLGTGDDKVIQAIRGLLKD